MKQAAHWCNDQTQTEVKFGKVWCCMCKVEIAGTWGYPSMRLRQGVPLCNKQTQGRHMGQGPACENCLVRTKLCESCQVSQVRQRYSAAPLMVQDAEGGWEHGAEFLKIPWLPSHLQAATCMLTAALQEMTGISSLNNL